MQYEEVLKMIAESEKRVDEMLKAARLERHERQPMSLERLQLILSYVAGILALTFGAVAVFMIIYFMGTEGRQRFDYRMRQKVTDTVVQKKAWLDSILMGDSIWGAHNRYGGEAITTSDIRLNKVKSGGCFSHQAIILTINSLRNYRPPFFIHQQEERRKRI